MSSKWSEHSLEYLDGVHPFLFTFWTHISLIFLSVGNVKKLTFLLLSYYLNSQTQRSTQYLSRVPFARLACHMWRHIPKFSTTIRKPPFWFLAQSYLKMQIFHRKKNRIFGKEHPLCLLDIFMYQISQRFFGLCISPLRYWKPDIKIFKYWWIKACFPKLVGEWTYNVPKQHCGNGPVYVCSDTIRVSSDSEEEVYDFLLF